FFGVFFFILFFFFFFSSRRRHTRFSRDWSSDVCSSDLMEPCWLRHRGLQGPLCNLARTSRKQVNQPSTSPTTTFNTKSLLLNNVLLTSRQSPCQSGIFRPPNIRTHRQETVSSPYS